MTDKLILNATVSYRDVDREEVLLLPVLFQLLQEAAILHANQYNTGTHAMNDRGASWVLNRMAVEIARYPRYAEPLRIETWSRGIKTFKGYREFRVYDRANALVLSGSSLWLYVNVRTKAIIRVPAEVAAGFPVCLEGPSFPDLETLEFVMPGATVPARSIAVRYSDVDVNEHVNNTAYLDFVQTALVRAGLPAHPRRVRIRFVKAIPADVASVEVRLERTAAGAAAFVISGGETPFAVGDTS